MSDDTLTDANLGEETATADIPSLEQMSDAGDASEPGDTGTPSQDATQALTTDTEPNTPSPEEAAADEAFAAAEETPKPSVAAAPALDLPPALAEILKDPARRDQLLNLHQLYGQQSNEIGKLRQAVQQYQGLGDPETLRATMQQQQEAARVATLKPWNRGHEQHQRFQTVREQWRVDQRRLDRVAPENREAVRASLEQDYSPDDLASLRQYDDWKNREESLSPEDREDRLREMSRQETMAMIQQWEQTQLQRMQSQAVIQQHGEVLGQHMQDVEWAMNPSTPRRDLAIELAKAKAELDALKGKSVTDARQVATAQARDRITKESAGISRDGGTRRPVNLQVEAARRAKNGEDPFEVMLELHEQSQNTFASQ